MGHEISKFLTDVPKLLTIYDTANKLAGAATLFQEAQKAAVNNKPAPQQVIIAADQIMKKLKPLLKPFLGKKIDFDLYKEIHYWGISNLTKDGRELTQDEQYQLTAIQDTLIALLEEEQDKNEIFLAEINETLQNLQNIFKEGMSELKKNIDKRLTEINKSFNPGSGLSFEQVTDENNNTWAMRYIERTIASASAVAVDIDVEAQAKAQAQAKEKSSEFALLKQEILQYNKWKDLLNDIKENAVAGPMDKRPPLAQLINLYDQTSRQEQTVKELKPVSQEKTEEIWFYKMIINIYEKIREAFSRPAETVAEEEKPQPRRKYYY